MAYVPSSPETETVLVPGEKVIDTFSIDSILIQLVQNQPTQTTMKVVWFEGYMDGGSFVGTVRKEAMLEGSSFLTAMNAPVTNGASQYDNLRDAIWAYMASVGLIPAGSVT